MKSFDPTKPVQTRDGRPARIICTNCKDVRLPIIALIQDPSGGEAALYYTSAGLMFWSGLECNCDLVNILVRHTRELWINVYPDSISAHLSKDLADLGRGGKAIACIKVPLDFEEGEGL